MTRDQQSSTKVLEAAEVSWLLSYGWHRNGVGWEHRKVHKGDVRPYSLRDAVAATRADLTLGWP